MQDSIIFKVARAMLKMENFHKVWGFVHAVVDENRGMDKLANAKPTGHWAANIGEGSQNIEMVEEGVPKALSSGWKIGPGIFDDALELG